MNKHWQIRTRMICTLLLICFVFACASVAYAESSQQGVNPVEPVATAGYINAEPSYPSATANASGTDEREQNVTGNATSMPSESGTSETFSPTSSPETTPSPSVAPTPGTSASPDITAQPSPTPSDTVTVAIPEAEAVQVKALYLEGLTAAREGERVTLKLILNIQNASGCSLLPFGVRLDISSGESFSSVTITQNDGVTFHDGLLWVEDAVARSGAVAVEGDSLRCSVKFVPFPVGNSGETVTITLTLIDASGHAVTLKDSDTDGQMIQTRYQIRRQQNTSVPAEELDATQVPANDEGLASQPEQNDTSEYADQPQAAASTNEPDVTGAETEALQETPDPNAAPVGDPSQTDGNTTMAPATTFTPEPTPEPTPVTRRLGISSSIPYDQLHVGDTLLLTAEITGYDGLNVSLQWQQNISGVWENIEGATEATLAVSITTDNLNSAWRYNIAVES